MAGVKFIAGSGRSGTTWVQDALAGANRLRPVFEPLHPHVSPMGNRFAHKALAPDDDHPELAEYLREVCAGRSHRLWTQFRRQRRWLLPPADEFRTMQDAGRLYRRWVKFVREMPRLAIVARHGDPIVKCIRANLMLGWLSRKCDCKIVLIVRHPAAVIESELRAGWNAKFALDRFKSDERLHDLTKGRYRGLLNRRLTAIESLATRWVIENQWVIEAASTNSVSVVSYERLKTSPRDEWVRIQRALDLPELPAPTLLARPSQQSSPNQANERGGEVDNPRWLRVLTRQQLSTIQGVLDEAQCELYTMSDPNPRDALLREHGLLSRNFRR